MVRISLPQRLKSHTGSMKNGSSPNASRNASPSRQPADQKPEWLTLKVTVVRARNLAAKDKNGYSDPFVTVVLDDSRSVTHAVTKNLNPEWNVAFDLPISEESSLLLQCVCWDKDRFGKDYLGEFDVALEDVFTNGQPLQEPRWFPLRCTRKKNDISGDVELQLSLADPLNPSATPEDIMHKFQSLTTLSPDSEGSSSDFGKLNRDESLGEDDREDDDDDDDGSGTSDETDDPTKPETIEKKKRRLRLKKLRRRKKARHYEFSGGSDVVGIVFLEITRIADLPPERNMTRTSFDVDPFVVASLGKKTYRTRVIRHNLNPQYDEKMIFQVLPHEKTYSLTFSVVDRDALSGNDLIGTATMPLQDIIATAPDADPETGLYSMKQPAFNADKLAPSTKQSRFRLPISRSSSATSLTKVAAKPGLISHKSSTTLAKTASPPDQPLAQQPATPGVPSPDGPIIPSLLAHNPDESDVIDADGDPELKDFKIPLSLKNKEQWEAKHLPELFIKSKYIPYAALRQQFWRALLRQYDADESGRISRIELSTMLDTLGSTLKESTINSLFSRFEKENGQDASNVELTYDQAVIALEDQLQKASRNSGNSSEDTPVKSQSRTDLVAMSTDTLGTPGEEGDYLQTDDLTDDKGEEHVVEIRECPICHQPRLNKKSDADIITHVALCASHDWRQVNNIVMAGFVTPSQARRKWYSKVITKISYGGYKLGANSANILVQDRITGQINEERMSVYVRLGIRLLYKGLKSRDMEKKRIRKLLKSLSIKQGRKYDDPASAREIENFIKFHNLNMDEVLLPMDQFKSFNEFFYRRLKPDARPCSAPDNPKIIVSPADCRSVVFNTMTQATTIWVKGREFSTARLLGDAYPEDAKRYVNGALGIFRLAPQDYHRFHIPVDGVMDTPKLIHGEYYTVNPMAIRSALDVYGENVRVVCPIDSVSHGRVMVICVGAMMVGSTVITRTGGEHVKRAEELGYFKFGGSTILLLFEPGQMKFDEDLVGNSDSALETLVTAGTSIGHSPEQAAHTPDMQKANVTKEEKEDATRRIQGSSVPMKANIS